MATIKKSYENAMAKAATTTYWVDYRPTNTSGVGVNRFSGVSRPLNPLELTIYNWVSRWYARYESGRPTETPVSTFDNMRYYFSTLNPGAYMDLLD